MTIRLALLVALGLGTGILSAAPAPAAPKVPPQLAKARLDAARKAYESYWLRLRNLGNVAPEPVYVWSRRWMEAQQATGEKDAERAAVQAHLDRMKELEKIFGKVALVGQGTQADASATQYYRIEAEIWLSQAKGK